MPFKNIFINLDFDGTTGIVDNIDIKIPFMVKDIIFKPLIPYITTGAKLYYIECTLVNDVIGACQGTTGKTAVTSKCTVFSYPNSQNARGTYEFRIYDVATGLLATAVVGNVLCQIEFIS